MDLCLSLSSACTRSPSVRCVSSVVCVGGNVSYMKITFHLFSSFTLLRSVIYVVRGRVKEGRKGCAFHVCEYITNILALTRVHILLLLLAALCNKHMRTCHTTRSLPPRTNKNFSFSCVPNCLSYVFTLIQDPPKKFVLVCVCGKLMNFLL